MIRFYLILLAWTTLIQPVQANNCKPWQAKFFNRTHLMVGDINITTNDMFDTSSNQQPASLFRLANKLHIKTKANVVRNQLLFRTGDQFLPRKLEESERNLRAQTYLKDVRILPHELCDNNKVSINVITRDSWTFTPGINFKRSGGNNTVSIQVQEQNILGSGKDIILRYKKESERRSKLLSYRDNHLFGSYHKLRLDLQDNSDGKGYILDLGLPFYQTDSKKSWGIKSSKLEKVTPTYDAGNVIDETTENKKDHSIYYGWSTGFHKQAISRFKVGWLFNKSHYFKPATLEDILKLTESYPWIEYQNFKTRYIKRSNFNTMGSIEDIPLTRNFSVGAGLLLKDFGSSNNHLKITSIYSKGVQLNKEFLGSMEFKATNYLGAGIKEGGSYNIKGELNHFNKSGNDIRISSTFKVSDNQLPSKHLYLGGDTGLRGYPKAYQSGNKSFVFQAEKRLHFDWHPLKVVKFGALAFTDIGSSWGQNQDPKLLADIGIGLRMIPTQSSSAKTLHFDLAIPLTERSKLDKFQLSIRTAKSF